ncbi:MAG: dehydratase [Burkholderiales bacterium 68-10]|jgi:acyl dehydratase|nr:MAG: dehydratase [Burkholderiales bacterium 68-10]
MIVYKTVNDLENLVGQEIGVSDWVLIEQNRINQFAESTGDFQWIHVDPEKAKSGPFGTTIAHGFLTLSLLPSLMNGAFQIEKFSAALNYGLDKVRFPSPVPVGSRLRGKFQLASWEKIEGNGAQLKLNMTIECEGSSKPACIAEPIVRFYN